MPRRLALAASLALTTVVTFAVVALGAQTGYFGFKGGGMSQAEVLPEPSPAPTAPAPIPTAEPKTITEYIYLDEAAPQSPGPSGFVESRRDDDEWEREWEYEDHDEHEHEHERGHEHEDEHEHEHGHGYEYEDEYEDDDDD